MDALPTPAWVPAAEADGWRTDVLAWISASLATLGRPATGAPRVHKARPWSIVLEVPTTDGPAWFKQNVPTLGPEPALLNVLTQQLPGRVPAPLATDTRRGWLLLPDHGATLRARARDDDPGLWADVVAQWSQTTRALAGRAEELEEIGVPRLGPAEAEPYLHGRIAELAALPSGDPAHLAPVDAARLTAVLPSVARAGEQLAALGLPDTLWHNDLHTNNVFDTPTGLVFFDLGDALVGSPLCDLLIPLRSLADARGGEFGRAVDAFADPGLALVIEAALEPWTDLVGVRDLRAAVPAALLLGVLGRSESWRRALPARNDGEYSDASAAWLLELVGGG
ncbi:MAG TPA: aminoglycoside phosphotransferase family protein [Propionicimonas sp.]|uniref:aminoglycoside phosphotransferase family protein n=1 Tax=Propionicimonas sp. TaxID=1955623 RepID=UPI002F42EA5A